MGGEHARREGRGREGEGLSEARKRKAGGQIEGKEMLRCQIDKLPKDADADTVIQACSCRWPDSIAEQRSRPGTSPLLFSCPNRE